MLLLDRFQLRDSILQVLSRALPLLLIQFWLLSAQDFSRPLIVNVDDQGAALQPSFDVHGDGTARFVWNRYAGHQERLHSTSFRNGRRSRSRELSAGQGVYWSPLYLADGIDSGWALWQQRHGQGWRIVARKLSDGFWQPIQSLSATS